MCIASGNLPRFLVFLFSEAPAGRHVYRQATCLATQAPAGRQVNREARKLEREQAKLDA